MNARTKTRSLAITLVMMFALLLPLATPIWAAEPEETTATVSFTPGQLTLIQTPALDFGNHSIEATTQVYEATNEITPVQVSDLRGGQGGWTLTATLSPFTLTDGITETLQGAYIEIENVAVSGVNETEGTAPTLGANLKLEADGTETAFLTAAVGAGSGVWQAAWAKNDISLSVLPGTARTGANNATLTWTLQAAD